MVTLQEHIDRGTLIRNAWKGTDEQGRETACLLAALSPEVYNSEKASACPASVMPAWLAYLTPNIDDNGSIEAWPAMVRRYALLANQWGKLTDTQWLRAQFQFRKACVQEAMANTDNKLVLVACNQVIDYLDSVIESGEGDEPRRSAAEYAAESAARSAARSAAWDNLTVKLFEAIEAEL